MMRVRVLLVDTNEDYFRKTKALLDVVLDTEYSVTWVASAAEAMEFLEGHDHDVCLLDLELGETNGVDVLRGLSASVIPSILLTPGRDLAADRAGTNAGAVDCLAKNDLDARTLERSIRYAIGNAQALRSARESEGRFRSVVEAATDGIAMLGSDGRIVTCNAAMEAVFGADPDQLIGMALLTLIESADNALERRFVESVEDEVLQATEAEGRARRFDGTDIPVEASLSTWLSEDGERFWSAIVRDITERKALADELVRQPFMDSLTGLANHTLLRQLVEARSADIFDDVYGRPDAHLVVILGVERYGPGSFEKVPDIVYPFNEVRVLVVNGTTVAGVAGGVSDSLSASDGYVTLTPGNTIALISKSGIYYVDGYELNARLIGKNLDVSPLAILSLGDNQVPVEDLADAHVVVVVGADWPDL